ncbi:NAD(P)H-dependent flavin oxidoreductase [Luteimonas panaciterrae]|uniref:NAD(P)H-dependent flavin oxidoreductase n=1 Tax=Luteimonas panaciterrae TaxID=363885 RepID=UPI001CFBC0FE|nr:nitronate monooxygenase [Luteimonas panaciterrae]
MTSPRARATAFCERFGLRTPILLGPMAGTPQTALSIAVANAGGMAALGALMLTPAQITAWMHDFRARSDGPCQINLWIPDPPPVRDAEAETAVRGFLGQWGPAVAENAGDAKLHDFAAQCDATLEARPAAISSIMGVFPPDVVARAKAAGIAWFAAATTLSEALQAEAAGADVIVAQSFEAGGHRGAFDAANAERQATGLFALLPRIVDRVRVPVIAAGGIADGRGIAAALTLGASAVQIGTGFLRTPEAGIASSWADAIAAAEPEDTWPTRAFSGRLGRSLATDYVRAAASEDAPRPAAYPVQRGLTAAMREAAAKSNDVSRMQAWAGQSAWLAPALPAAECIERWWNEAEALLPSK